MQGLRVLMLGQGRIELDGQALTRLLAPKQQAIVYYLAWAGETVPRSRLANLLWGGLDDDAARGNLRGALSRLRRWLPGVLAVGGDRVGFAPDVAVTVDLQALVRAQDPVSSDADRRAAAAGWRGPLLADFDVGAADEFEGWLASARQRALQQILALRGDLLRRAEAAGARDEALAHARALLDVDEADEEAHMALMRLLAAGGQRVAAIAQYEACRAALAERLGARPSAACYALYTRIHGDAAPAGRVAEGAPAPVPVVPGEAGALLPVAQPPPTPVGRDAELAQIDERLSDPACRWLTIVGPGGTGKTWLAMTLAHRLAPRCRHGVLWLSGRDDADGALRDPESLSRHIVARTDADRLLDGALLLVLDNLETVARPRDFARLLARRAPGVKVLATSQRRVGGSGEWLFELGGLSLERSDADAPASSPAAQLFVAALRRLLPHFDAAAQAEPVERICALLGGLPIALELAARSAYTAGIGPVLDRLQAGALPGEPGAAAGDDSHPGLLPVLEDAWARLDDTARAGALRLARLPVAFDATLAQAVGVDADTLAALRAQSWLMQLGADARLAFHPVQQLFVRRQAADDAAVLDDVVDHLDRLLPAALPFQAGPPDAAGDAARCALAASAVASPALLAAACGRLCAQGDPERLASWIDRCVALLWAADRQAEAAALLARALERGDLPSWRLVGWGLVRAELLNGCGDSTAAQRSFVAALARHGLCDQDHVQAPWAGLPAALQRVLTLAGEPPGGPARDAFRALLLRSCGYLYAMLAFSPDPQPMLRIALLMDLLSRRLNLAVAMRRQGLATGAALTGHLWLGERIGSAVGRAPRALADDPRLDALLDESRGVFRVALGDWAGVVTELDAAARRFEALRYGRHTMETLALAAKLCFFEGRLDEAHVRFATLSERALQRPGESWRAWGPVGLCEVMLCLDSADDALLQRLYQRAADVMTEMENIDAAYTLRRQGLAARLAWRRGDADGAAAAVQAGVAAARRMRAGYWAHEGIAGLGDTLLALLAATPGAGATARVLESAWDDLQPPLRQHGRRMRPAVALVARLHGQRAVLLGDRARGVALLERAVRAGEPQGMRVEAARACDALAAADPHGPWPGRGRALWRTLRAPMRR